MRKVLIIQERLPDYRVLFFEKLRVALEGNNIELVLIHGDAGKTQRDEKADAGELEWTVKRRLRVLGVGRRTITWLSAPLRCLNAEAIVVEQANRHLYTYVLMALKPFLRYRLVFWGHGSNLQANNTNLSRLLECWKQLCIGSADLCLAYTRGSAERMIDAGMREEKVVVVNNAVDTSWAWTVRANPGSHTCAYLGALYSEKEIDLLLTASAMIAESDSNFSLRIIGDGPDMKKVKEWERCCSWLTSYGRVNGKAKSALLDGVSLLLNPGLVGLVAHDSLAAGLPIVTRAKALHSPEIEYLDGGRTAEIVQGERADEYALAIRGLLEAPDRIARMHACCLEDAKSFSLDAMVENYVYGLNLALL